MRFLFTVPNGVEKLLAHRKKHTLRLVTEHRKKYPISPEKHRAQIYIQLKIGDCEITDTRRIKLSEIDNDIARIDGFQSREECIEELIRLHRLDVTDPRLPDVEFDFIAFDPNWPRQKIVEIEENSIVECGRCGSEHREWDMEICGEWGFLCSMCQAEIWQAPNPPIKFFQFQVRKILQDKGLKLSTNFTNKWWNGLYLNWKDSGVTLTGFIEMKRSEVWTTNEQMG